MLLLPASLLSLALHASLLAADRAPTAVRQVAPDAGEKILREHLAFAPWTFVDASLAARLFLDAQDDERSNADDAHSLPRPYRPAFASHQDGDTAQSHNYLRRLLRPRSAACPSGMSGCDAIGQPNKCCQDGTTCTRVDDDAVGGIACCPQGNSCGGRVGACPADAVSCPAELGGGCCIPGYVCQGVGCVPSASATTATTTVVNTATSSPSTTTITSTRTTWVDGAPSTVIVTEIVTLTSSRPPSTSTTTLTVTESGSSSTVTGGAPWRPTGTTTAKPSSSSDTTTDENTSTQEGCPTGFYGCLATHGGGCCQTDRDCKTTSCPPQASTTIVSDGKTVVVPASDVPTSATSTCAAGWFLCGSDAGDRPGCCPSGYDCGTASCFSTSASQTGSVQKEQPKKDGGGVKAASLLVTLIVAATVAACNVM